MAAMRKRVGIIGASGNVGRGAAELLAENKDIIVRLGCRNPPQSIEKAQNIEIMTVDIYIKEQLAEFVRDCSAVINCAGPASKIRTRVAKVCMEKEICYIDAAGNKSVYKELKQLSPSCPPAMSIVSAGIYPGLTEMFAIWAVNRIDGEIYFLEEIFFGNNMLSLHAAEDICETLDADEGKTFAYYDNGTIAKIDFDARGQEKIPGLAEPVSVIPVIYDEFAAAMKMKRVNKAVFYNSFSSQGSLIRFVDIKNNLKNNTEYSSDKTALVRDIFWSPELEQIFTLIVELKAEENGQLVRKRYVLSSTENWNTVTGYVAAILSRQILSGNDKKPGLYFASEIADIDNIIEELRINSVITIKCFQKIVQKGP